MEELDADLLINSMQPMSAKDEAAGMPVVQFRAMLAGLIGAPSVAATPAPTTAFAPATPAAHAKSAAKPKPAATPTQRP